MRKQLCNRCGDTYQKAREGGEIQMKYGNVEISADLCQACYSEMTRHYHGEDHD